MTETDTETCIPEVWIGACYCKDCENYDLVFEIPRCGYFVQCHDTLYAYEEGVHGEVLKKVYPIDFHKRNAHDEHSFF